VKTLMSAVVHSGAASRTSRRPIARLLGLAPAALLIGGLFTVWTGSLAAQVAAASGASMQLGNGPTRSATDLTPASASGDWPQFHNDPTHEGYNAAETTISAANVADLGVAWTADTGNAIRSSPAVANGVVYVGSWDGKLYAYAVGCASGGGSCTPLWTAAPATTGASIYSSPAVADGVVYVGDTYGKLYAYAVGCNSGGGTCTPLWTATTEGAIWSSPAVANGVVYVGSEGAKLYAYAVGCNSGGGSCTPLWTASTNGPINASSPAVANGVVYVGSMDDKLYAYAVGCNSGGGSCTPLWTATTGGAIESSPAVANGVVYVGSYDDKLYAYAVGCNSGGGSCTPLWTASTNGPINASSPAVANGVVYVGSMDDALYAFSLGGSAPTSAWDAYYDDPDNQSTWSAFCVAGGATFTADANGVPACTPSGSVNVAVPPAGPKYVYPGFQCAELAERYLYVTYGWPGVLDSQGHADNGDEIVSTYASAHPNDAVVRPNGSGSPPAQGDVISFSADSSFNSSSGGHVAIVTGVSVNGTTGTVTIVGQNQLSPVQAGPATLNMSEQAGAWTIDYTSFDSKLLYIEWLHVTIPSASQSIGPSGGTVSLAGGTPSVSVPSAALSFNGTVRLTQLQASDPPDPLVPGLTLVGLPVNVMLPTLQAGSSAQLTLPFDPSQVPAGSSLAIFQDGAWTRLPTTQSDNTLTAAITQGGTYAPLAAPDTLAVSGFPNPTVAGASHNLTVTVSDGYGTAAGYTGTVHFTSSDGAAVLPSDYTFTSADAGTHNFGVTLKTAGNQSVTVTDTVTASINGTQSGIVVVTVPGKPTAVTATAGNASALVSWTAPSANGSAITGYTVASSPGGKTWTTSGALSCTVSGLTNGQAYTFTVHATNGVGDGSESDPSAAVTPVAPRTGSTYHAITPTRVLDTRNGTGGLSGPFTNHSARTFTVGSVPAGAIAVTGNLTVTGQTSSGYLFIGPVATNNPGSSTLNFPVGDDRANAVTVALGAGSTLSITFVAPSNGPTAHAIFDVTGYFTPDASGATYHALTPTRVLDTRSGTGGLAGPFTNHAARTFTVGGVPAGAIAVTGNLTVTGQTSSGYLSIGPVATDNPGSSTLNFPVGDDRANAVTVALGAGGALSITFVAPSNGPSVHAIFDVTGYFTPDMSGATYFALTPARALDTRNGTGGLGGPFTNHAARTFTVGGVPAGAIAVTGNLTVTGQTSSGFFSIGPVAANNPGSSTLNFPVGDDRANAVTVALSGTGTLSITFVAPSNGPTAQAIFDVTGYFTP
jgi:outer membrane protein assembly factor BamB